MTKNKLNNFSLGDIIKFYKCVQKENCIIVGEIVKVLRNRAGFLKYHVKIDLNKNINKFSKMSDILEVPSYHVIGKHSRILDKELHENRYRMMKKQIAAIGDPVHFKHKDGKSKGLVLDLCFSFNEGLVYLLKIDDNNVVYENFLEENLIFSHAYAAHLNKENLDKLFLVKECDIINAVSFMSYQEALKDLVSSFERHTFSKYMPSSKKMGDKKWHGRLNNGGYIAWMGRTALISLKDDNGVWETLISQGLKIDNSPPFKTKTLKNGDPVYITGYVKTKSGLLSPTWFEGNRISCFDDFFVFTTEGVNSPRFSGLTNFQILKLFDKNTIFQKLVEDKMEDDKRKLKINENPVKRLYCCL